jgi:UrcA family protein
MHIRTIELATTLSFLVGTAATAAPVRVNDAVGTAFVSYADLHLASAKDRQRLEWRVRDAASCVCTDDNRASPVPYVNTACFAAAMTDAARQIDRALARTRGEPTLALAPPTSIQAPPR